ncbi:type 1 glutamine amidotransferase domain-containing protein [Nocardioides deserti]|uniref:Type 1 glutamine amidotransferase n=1 Tax=Nocardioides deserti TaxID=1588644 RepID=A0ABR6U439_9ACTN|nr:type 1 glutamine amidotransferase domain-containing protein [Nocardioides deserti]MBC2959191.1 type 1 glutamine amidotransferase [Nocardioides deserti]GGO68441.1 glutamine amidotransferase [Nocardioides deserti]
MAEQSVSGKTIAFLVSTEGIEQAELTGPWEAVKEAGGTPVLLSTESGEVQAFNHLDKADTFGVDKVVDDVSVDDFDGLVLPGGAPNGDLLRTFESAVTFVRGFVESGKPTAVICHAPWVLVEADVVRGKQVTSWPSLQTDLRNAGAEWVDQEVVVDGNLVTSRQPDDIPAFNREFLALVAQAA